uniref:Uncharacterized protein n=1 Tax=Knipowitschia caucasica TaxID=637954 RepID=A0AAV2M0Q0_KNICA
MSQTFPEVIGVTSTQHVTSAISFRTQEESEMQRAYVPVVYIEQAHSWCTAGRTTIDWHSEVLQSGLLSGTWLPSSPRGKSPDTRSKVLRLKPVLTGASAVSAETLWERSWAFSSQLCQR